MQIRIRQNDAYTDPQHYPEKKVVNVYKLQIREYLPTRDFKPMVGILNKLFNFMKMTGTMVSSKSIKVVPSNRHKRSGAFWIVWSRPFRLDCPIKWGSRFFLLKISLVDRRGEMQYFFFRPVV
jgi:hypothetical protein